MKDNIKINGDVYGVGVVKGGTVNQNLILPKHKTPSQLTSKLGKDTIIGRAKELEEIDTLLKESSSLLLINGIGGIGKSTIASYYLHSQKENLDYYGFFEGLDSFTTELREPLALKQEKEDDAFMEALSKLRNLKGNKLLVFDDVKDIDDNQNKIEKILALKDSGYKILLTSREEIEDVEQYYLDVLSLTDAKELFNSIYKVEDEVLLEEILEYLDCHAFFVEKTAMSIKKTLTPQMVRDKFEKGDFSKISVKRKKNFNKFLNELFTLDGLDNDEVLMLKQFSVFPSIEIDFENLEYAFQKEEDTEFEELLNFLSENGWLIKIEVGYKLHQIIKEYILTNHIPSFEEIEVVVDSFNGLIKNSADAQVAMNNRENIIYFESLCTLLEKLEIENEKVGEFFACFGNLYQHLGLYEKAEFFYLKDLKIREKLLGEEHFNTTTSYNNLALLYETIGIYEKAEPLYLKALDIREKLLGDEDFHTAQSYNNLASLYDSMEIYEKAKLLYLKALDIMENLFGEINSDTALIYNNLAGLYSLIGAYEQAETLYLKALKILEKLFGEEHPDTITSYNNIAIFYYVKKEYLKAYEYMKIAVELSLRVLPEGHPALENSKNDLNVIKNCL